MGGMFRHSWTKEGGVGGMEREKRRERRRGRREDRWIERGGKKERHFLRREFIAFSL